MALTLRTAAFAVAAAIVAAPALATVGETIDSAGRAASSVATKTGKAVKKGVKAAASGVERGAKAAGSAADRGAQKLGIPGAGASSPRP